MTRNQKMAVEILKMLDSKICAEVGYDTGDDSVVFAWNHENKKIKTIDLPSKWTTLRRIQNLTKSSQ